MQRRKPSPAPSVIVNSRSRRYDTPNPNRVSPKFRQMRWLGGKDAGVQQQKMGRLSPGLGTLHCLGDLVQPIAMLNRMSKVHSTEADESIQETCISAFRLLASRLHWEHYPANLRVFSGLRDLYSLNSARFYRVSSKRHFAVANCGQFYRLRAATMLPSFSVDVAVCHVFHQ